MSEHTPEPWISAEYDGRHIEIMSALDTHIIFFPRTQLGIANARRIVACVNACQGVATEFLEQNPAPDSPATLMRAAQSRADEAERLLRDIRDADPIDMALDPQWPARQARAFLAQHGDGK